MISPVVGMNARALALPVPSTGLFGEAAMGFPA
jgi:hypothetical protein